LLLYSFFFPPAMAGLRSSHTGSQQKATNEHHGAQVSEHRHHHEPRSNCHETRDEGIGQHGRPTSESHKDVMKRVQQKGAKRVGLQKVLWTANITELGFADDTSQFDTKIVGGSSASVGEYPYYGKSCLSSWEIKLLQIFRINL
jgi:hypothetical protein